ncbi:MULTISPECIES: hypothetical protein [Bacillaceae]|uniref:hypothetical protein n=1 Tax=Bacillaceae TaxID=186817 RepID=UPI001E50078B|nr:MULTISPECIES: hypothetical protein [Bacillaceae]MCE4050459.1 hypothetical protein [Bacillus sp. Au-Bac7]MCM3030480.1 hypothetical protein [Niallia sp. MER 6]MDL0434596.1 hypothetical protein [Niallia sp. SS-2023]UPO88437.1 hypothetical protein L8T27_004530 [Niallia sp. Man26]
MDEDIQNAVDEQDDSVKAEEDYYYDFMLGRKVYRKKQHDDALYERRERRERTKGDSWILGQHGRQREEDSQQPEDNNKVMNFLDEIDMNLVFSNIELFMSSANELKPLINKVKPMLKKWMD